MKRTVGRWNGRRGNLRRLLAAGVLLAGACAPDQPAGSVPAGGPALPAPPAWGYEGAEGPDYWSELAPDFAACQAGQAQSPIDVTPAQTLLAPWLPSLELTAQAAPLGVVQTEHGLRLDHPGGLRLALGRLDFVLRDAAVHLPAEHTLAGFQADAEVQWRFSDTRGRTVILAVPVVEGEASPLLERLRATLPAEPVRTKPGQAAQARAETRLAVADLLPAQADYYQYDGSLTTPPCTEGVTWVLLRHPLQGSREQLDALRALSPQNARPRQPLNDRVVQQSNPWRDPPQANP